MNKMKTLDDYPYDPNMTLQQVREATGLDKLRGVSFARQALFDLWQHIHQPKVQIESNRRHHETEHEKRVEYAAKAHAGMYGTEEQDLALEVFGLSFPSVVPRELLQSFFRGVAGLRHTRANRVTGEQ